MDSFRSPIPLQRRQRCLRRLRKVSKFLKTVIIPSTVLGTGTNCPIVNVLHRLPPACVEELAPPSLLSPTLRYELREE